MSLANVGNATSGFHAPKPKEQRAFSETVVGTAPENVKDSIARGLAAQVKKVKVMLTRDEVLDRLNIRGDEEKFARFDAMWARLVNTYQAMAASHVDGLNMPISYRGKNYVMTAKSMDAGGGLAAPGLQPDSFRLEEKSVSRLAFALNLMPADRQTLPIAPPEGYVAIEDLPSRLSNSPADIKLNRPRFMAALIQSIGRNLKEDYKCRGAGTITVLTGKMGEEIPLRYCRLGEGSNRQRYSYFLYLGTEPREQQIALQNLDKAVEHYITKDAFTPLHYMNAVFERATAAEPTIKPAARGR
jgi:hypothetical protein